MMKFVLAVLLSVVVLPEMTTAEIITFDFENAAGAGGDLDGHTTASTPASNGGITLTLAASTGLSSGTPVGTFNLTTNGFGINNTGSDVTDAFDADLTAVPLPLIDFANFQITSNVALSNLELVSLKFNRFTSGDEGAVLLDGAVFGSWGPTFVNSELDGTNVLSVNESGITAGNEITLSYVSGNGFGLQFITFNATAAAAVPEPGTMLTAAFLCGGFLLRRRLGRACPDHTVSPDPSGQE